jgi:hypothetical protein
MSAKHTPGPWHTSEPPILTEARSDVLNQPKLCQIRLYAPSGLISFMITELDDDPTDDLTIAEAQANARLIAAAPELLEALEKIVSCCRADKELSPDVEFYLPKAEAAIRRAKGE